MIQVNEKLNTFLGLNNMLNPSSPEYREGMAYRSYRMRLSEKGLWDLQPALAAASGMPSAQACPHGSGNYFKHLYVDNTSKIVTGELTFVFDVGPNKKLYSTNGSDAIKNAVGDVADLTRPAMSSATVQTTGVQGRQDLGTYYYVCTIYNTTYDREGLPSATAKPATFTEDSTNVLLTSGTAATSTDKIRFYRSKRTYVTDGIYNPTNIFYYLGEITSGTTYTDYLNDEELTNNEYEGRGKCPPSAIDCLASYNNRMMYLKGNILYWSSAGRPEEVAQEYTVTIGSGEPVKCKPKLATGVYGEAKYEITELSGQKALAAIPFNGRLYIFTASRMGYIEPTNKLEGYRFKLLRDGIGVTSDKVLAMSPYGVFGADRKGIWLLTSDSDIQRLSDNKIDLLAGEDTTFTNANFTNSFGFWCPQQNEYLWGVSGKFIAYQADRGIFAGPYDYAITGGCAVFGEIGSLVYLTGAQTLSATDTDTGNGNLSFWLGQSAPTTIKDQLKIEVVHSKVPATSVTYSVYQNSITSTTGAQELLNKTYSGSIGVLSTVGSGRYFKVNLTVPYNSPIAIVQYRYNPIPWVEESGR